MGIKRNSLRCIFAESIWIKSKWILEKLFHPSHYISVKLPKKSLFLLVRSNTLKMPLCCQRYKTINASHSPVPNESLNPYPSFGQNFREASINMPREDFGPLIHINWGSSKLLQVDGTHKDRGVGRNSDATDDVLLLQPAERPWDGRVQPQRLLQNLRQQEAQEVS